jgi:hypothetical protein
MFTLELPEIFKIELNCELNTPSASLFGVGAVSFIALIRVFTLTTFLRKQKNLQLLPRFSTDQLAQRAHYPHSLHLSFLFKGLKIKHCQNKL